MKASEIIIKSVVCRQASYNIYPNDPDELFNTCWLIIKEKELADDTWTPKDPKHYFLRMMKNKVNDWRKKRKFVNIEKIPETDIEDPYLASDIPCKAFVNEWINETTDDENLLFLKNIITLALYSKEINDAIKSTGISRTAFWRYHKLAKKRIYDDYHASNHCNIPSTSLV